MRTILTFLYERSCISRLRRTPLCVMALGARAVEPAVIAVGVLCVHVLFGRETQSLGLLSTGVEVVHAG